MEAEDGKQESNEVSGSINHGRMSITEEEDEVGEDLSEEDDISNEDLSEDEDDDDDEDYDIYYGGDNEDLDDGRAGCHGVGPGSQFNNNDDPEYFAYECLSVAQVKDLLTENISKVCSSVQVRNSFEYFVFEKKASFLKCTSSKINSFHNFCAKKVLYFICVLEEFRLTYFDRV